MTKDEGLRRKFLLSQKLGPGLDYPKNAFAFFWARYGDNNYPPAFHAVPLLHKKGTLKTDANRIRFY